MSNYSRGEVVLVRYPFSDYQVPKLDPPLSKLRTLRTHYRTLSGSSRQLFVVVVGI
jgi:hypothetical protein